MIEAYGGKCECPHCDVTIPAFLTLEHKSKDGAAHRRQVGRNAQAQLLDLKRREWPSDEYGLLCFNCNLGAGMGECPHIIELGGKPAGISHQGPERRAAVAQTEASSAINSSQVTHYHGDSCPGGHYGTMPSD